MWGDSLRASLKRVFALVVWIAAALNVAKGIPHFVHELGFPYYVLDYEHGFIKRALWGSIFSPFVAGHDAAAQERTVLAVHTLLAFVVWSVLLAWGLSLARKAESEHVRTAILAGTAGFFLSQSPTTTTHLAGYLDVVIFAIAVAAAYLAHRGRVRAAGAVAFFGPLVHEAFLFLWLPLLLITARSVLRTPKDERRRAAIEVLPLLSPLACALVVQAFASKSATAAALSALPVSEGVREIFRTQQFGLTLGNAFTYLMTKYAAMPGQVALACAFFLPATFVVAACAASLDSSPSRWRRIAFSVLVSLSPCIVLLIAWDLSRFLVWSTFAALLLVFANARDARAAGAPRPARPLPMFAGVAILALLSTGPHVYAYFEYAFGDPGFSPSVMRSTPGAHVTYAFLDAYNATFAAAPYTSKKTCKLTLDHAVAATDPPCSWEIEKRGGWVETKDFSVRPGRTIYRATVRPLERPDCPTATKASISVWVFRRFMNRAPPLVVDVPPGGGVVERQVDLNAEEAAMGHVRVGIEAVDGCLRIDEITAAPAGK